ncbi:hypothetical protein [Rhizobium sp. GCM10022189]|uniref:hypothetical protein n=1 Tax=Rhizobium sp. GCM10022189 TaxID=3252654 RepID=UPI00361044A2
MREKKRLDCDCCRGCHILGVGFVKRLLSLLAAVSFLASGAIAQDAEEDTLDTVIRLTGRVDPYLQAIYQDHRDVALYVYQQSSRQKSPEQRKTIAAVIATYGTPALTRAGDSAIIAVMNETAALAEIVADKYPEGCEYFFTGNMPDWYSIVEVRNGRMDDRRAKANAYHDGKLRSPVPLMSDDAAYALMTQYLGITSEDLRKALAAPNGVSDEDMCSIAKKLYNVGAVPTNLQGDWGRTLLSLGPVPERQRPAAAAKAASGAAAQQAQADGFEQEMRILAGINPFVHAIFMDHEDEARQLFASRDKVDPRQQTAAIVAKYGNAALARASDAAAIDVQMKMAALVEAVARYYPQGCKDLVAMQSPKAQAIPQVKERVWQYLESKRLAYEDGKARAPQTVRLTAEDIVQIATQRLGVTLEEMRKVSNPAQLSDEEACSITMKLNRIDLIPEAQRGMWARAAMGGS